MELQELSVVELVVELQELSFSSRCWSDLCPAVGMEAGIEGCEDGGEEKKVPCSSFTTLSG